MTPAHAIEGLAGFTVIAVVVVWIAVERTRERVREVERAAEFRRQVARQQARIAAGMPFGHPDEVGPAGLLEEVKHGVLYDQVREVFAAEIGDEP